MYGKSYESKFEGSMVGSGLAVFAVWDYMTTKARDGYVEVNPELLAFTLGGREQDPSEIVQALEFLQRPDPRSRSQKEGGRRIVKEGQFQYRLVNWGEYNRIRTEEDRREYNRRKQAEYRAKRRSSPPDAHEVEAVRCDGNGDEPGFDSAVTRSLPVGLQ
jgi:hypothetical protein